MKKYIFLPLFLLFLSAAGTGSEDVIESLVPGSVSLFLRTEAVGSFSADLKTILTALPENQTAGFRRAAGAFGMDLYSPEVLKKAGVDVKRRAGLGFSDSMNVFVMVPVSAPDITASSFIKAVIKMDSSGKQDLFPVPGKYRDVPVTQMGKDIFFFSMKGYFFICSSPEGVKEILDSVLDKKQMLLERTDYRKFLMNSCSPEDFVSLFADRTMLAGMISVQKDQKADTGAEYIGAGIKYVRGKLSLFAGIDFSAGNSVREQVSAPADDFSSVFRTGRAGRALFSEDMSCCMFFSLDPSELSRNMDRMPEISRFLEEQEQTLEKRTGLSLKRELIPAGSGIISLFMKQDPQDSGIFVSLKKEDSGEVLYEKIKAFLKKQNRNTEDPLFLRDEQGGKYVSCTEDGLFFADSQEMLGQMMASREKNTGPEKFLKKDLSNVWGFLWLKGWMAEGRQQDDFLLLFKKHGSFVFAEAEMNLMSGRQH